jgi:hypothetical protein
MTTAPFKRGDRVRLRGIYDDGRERRVTSCRRDRLCASGYRVKLDPPTPALCASWCVSLCDSAASQARKSLRKSDTSLVAKVLACFGYHVAVDAPSHREATRQAIDLIRGATRRKTRVTDQAKKELR